MYSDDETKNSEDDSDKMFADVKESAIDNVESSEDEAVSDADNDETRSDSEVVFDTPAKVTTDNKESLVLDEAVSNGQNKLLATSRNRRKQLQFGTSSAVKFDYVPVGFRMEGEQVFAKNGRLLTTPAEISTMTAAQSVDYDDKTRRVPVAQDLTGMTHFRYYNTYPFIAKRFSQTQRVLLATRRLPRTKNLKVLHVPTNPINIEDVLYKITRTLFVGRARVGFVTIMPIQALQ